MGERLRIALVYDAIYPWVSGGAERRCHELGRRLANRHEVHLIGWQWWDGPSTLEREGMTMHGVGRPPAMYGPDGKRTVREAIAFSARLLPVLARGGWDVIDCSATPYLPVYPARVASLLTRTPMVVTWHEFWGEHWAEYLPSRPVVARVARLLEHGARRLGDRVVAVSPFTARAMSMADSRRLRVVPNGVDADELRNAVPARDAAPVVFLGRLIDEKRVDLLLEAMAAVAARQPEARCDIIGDGPELRALRRRAAALDLDRRVRFMGHLPAHEIPGRLKAARILVMPSAREGYGIAVAEAMAAGTVPIVARGPFTAAPDLVRDGIDGLLVEPTAASIAAAISDLLGDEARWHHMADAAAVAGRAHDWDRVAREVEQAYLDACRGRSAAWPRESAGWL